MAPPTKSSNGTKKNGTKRKLAESTSSSTNGTADDGAKQQQDEAVETVWTLPRIRSRIRELVEQIPSISATQSSLRMVDIPAMEEWCRKVRYIIRNYNLVLNFITSAVYVWAPSRTGHSNQNLTALKEFKNDSSAKLDIIINHCNRILTPNISTVLRKKIKTIDKDTGTETEVYHYDDVIDDEDLLKLNREHLVQEGLPKRDLLKVTMQGMVQCITDYLQAEQDSGSSSDYRSSMAY